MSEKLYSIYHQEIPSFLLPFLESPEMKRIDHVGMHCGMEYTSFPFYKDFKKYSRYEHSLGVALIVYHFTSSEKMSLSGLFHDIATPSFAHVIDFLNGDHEKQESTEEKTLSILFGSKVILSELKKINISLNEVSDYHIYPIADNDSPKLSSDRLEYTLHNFYNYDLATLDEIKEMYDDLCICKNEEGEDEISFQTESLAKKFALLTLKNGQIYVTKEDRFAMEYLAQLIKKAIQRKVLSEDDLYTTEENVIEKLNQDEISKQDFLSFRNLKRVRLEEKPSNEYSYQIHAKKRYIDPLVKDKGRISSLDPEVKKEIQSFLDEDFSDYITID